ncbi:uncharacterized protein [Halyomorpha halys]|uniref:uncharacterized protein n=1 Tax=Halyomorpha halys TaxID=286706 RepID=UPI0006D4E6C1
MINIGFKRSNYDFCFYSKKEVFFVLYVDDGLVAGEDESVQEFINQLKDEFNIREIEVASFLGMKFERNNNTIKVTQAHVVEKLLKNYNMQDCKRVTTPMEVGCWFEETKGLEEKIPYRSLVCSLLYLSTMTRPDLSFCVSFLARYLDKGTQQTWKAAKRALRYLKDTKEMGIIFGKNEDIDLIGFSDADWAGDIETRRSVRGFMAFLAGNPVAWHSRKQTCVALSTMEAEYIAAGIAAQELVNLCGLISEC